MLALRANPFRDPPDGRVVEQQRFGNCLQQVHRVVVPPDMCELVREDRFDLRRRQRRDGGDRQENHGTHPADDRWNFHGNRLYDVNGGGQAKSMRQPAAGRLPARRRRGKSRAMQRPHVPPAAGHACEQQGDAEHPRKREACDDAVPIERRKQRGTGFARPNREARSRRTARLNRCARWSRCVRASARLKPRVPPIRRSASL
jgi:hypothetical protein